MKSEKVNISIPKSWFKKALPFILTAVLSSSGVAGFETVTRNSSDYSTQINELNAKYADLNLRLGNAESVNQSILVQLSDIKEQNKATQKLVESILLQMADRR